MNEFAVNIAIPPTKDESENVVVTGPPQRVAEAIEGLHRKVQDIEADIEDKVSQNITFLCFCCCVQLPSISLYIPVSRVCISGKEDPTHEIFYLL